MASTNNTQAIKNIISDAVMTRFGVELFRRTMTDKSATGQVHKANKATDDAGRYVKQLFNPAALKPFEAITAAARAVIAKHAVPWDGAGTYILAIAKFQEYDNAMHNLRADFEKERETFIQNYQTHINEAAARLGKLFDTQNYTSVESLREDCAFKIEYLPVPAYTDIRVQDDEIQARMVDAISSAYTGLVMSLADQMYDEVKGAHDQLAEGERFRIERVERLQEMVTKVRTYNMTNDPRVDEALSMIETKVIGELNTYIATRNQRNTGKDEKELAKEATKAKLAEVAISLAGLFV